MSLLIGGIISGVIGLVSLIFWWGDFMTIVKGAFPICLLLGGALAVYVGIDEMQEKMLNNIQEIKARKGPVIAIITRGDEKIREIADDVIEIPPTLDILNPILSVIPCQLLAYYCARFLKREIDQPRNLAKSVTVR